MARSTRIRYTIVVLALLIDMMSYMDRVCISVAAPAMRDEFGFTATEMGSVFSIFSLAYFLFLTPWGMLADRFGARGIVSLAIFWWSAFTALTGAAWSLVSLLAIRFIFGAVEAALSPSIASAYKRWIPVSERATAFGAFLSGGRIGGAATPPIAAFLVIQYGWRTMFQTFAIVGVVWVGLWYSWFRNYPKEHAWVNAEELKLIEGEEQVEPDRPAVGGKGPSWSRLLTSRPLLLLLAVAFGYTFMWQFYITWFPTYLIESRGMSLTQAAGYAGLPFAFGVAANWIGGLLSDALSRKYSPQFGRTSLGFCALILSALTLYVGLYLPDSSAAAIVIALAAGFGDLALGAFWASAVAIGGAAAGAVSGLMNSASNFGGFVSPVLMGWIYERWNNWNTVLLAGVFTNTVAAFLWLGVNPRSRSGKECSLASQDLEVTDPKSPR